jgi:DNA/RNA-binding domain of Phe-tRNA-synthetase-like protein
MGRTRGRDISVFPEGLQRRVEMTYIIEQRVFQMFPSFRRGVIVAHGIDNTSPMAAASEALYNAVRQVPADSSATESERIGAWNEAYRTCGISPDKCTPSVRFLFEQIRKGKPPRSISKLVDLMNATSVKWMVPCGGDSLDAIPGDLRLGIATGDETFAPLFKPLAIEHPQLGEIIYFTPQTRQVMCRRWTWRNADFSKIKPDTASVVVNIDALPPFDDNCLKQAVEEFANAISATCGGTIYTNVLSADHTEIDIRRK